MIDTDDFEVWLRTVCFQKPTPEAYDLAKDAWEASKAARRAKMCEAEAAQPAADRLVRLIEGKQAIADLVEGAVLHYRASVDNYDGRLPNMGALVGKLESMLTISHVECANCGATYVCDSRFATAAAGTPSRRRAKPLDQLDADGNGCGAEEQCAPL